MIRASLFLAASLVATSAFALESAPNCDVPPAPLAGKDLTVRGSTTLRPISVRAMSTFPEVAPNLRVHQDALGSSAGIRQWIEGYCRNNGIPAADCDLKGDGLLGIDDGNGPFDGRGDYRFGFDSDADVAQASRKIKGSEKLHAESVGMCVVEHVLAKDGLGIAVGTGNDVTSLTADDIRFIFENDMQTACGGGQCTWSILGLGTSNDPVVPVSRTTEGGTFGAFIDLYGVDDALLLSNPSVAFVGSNDEIAALVGDGTYPGALGYIGISFQNSALRSVPVAPTGGDTPVAASFASVQAGAFAFARDLNAYTNGYPGLGDPRRTWLDHLYSPIGQAHVVEIGFVPASSVSSPALDNTQYIVEPLFKSILGNDINNTIPERLGRIAAALEVLDSDPGNSPAQTDNIESQFAIEEAVIADQAIVDNLIERLAGGALDGISATRLDRAIEARSAADDAVAGCSPVFPVTCSLDEFEAWAAALDAAYDSAVVASRRGGFDPRMPTGLGGSKGKLK